MTRLLPLILIVFFSVCGCKALKNKNKSIQQIAITIKQDGKVIKPIDGIITLKKASFDFIFELPIDRGVMVHASYNDSISKISLRGETPTIFDNSNVIAVDLFNRESTLYLTDDSVNVSYYASEEEHTFNEIVTLPGGCRGIRTITNIYSIATASNNRVKDVDETVYLTFAGVNLAEGVPANPFVLLQNIEIDWK